MQISLHPPLKRNKSLFALEQLILNVVILTIGTFGDVQPYGALGVGIQEAGIKVRFTTHEPFRQFVELHGLKLAVFDGDPLKWAAGEELKSLVEAGCDFGGWMNRLKTLAKPLIENILNSYWYATQCANAIIYSPLAWAGYDTRTSDLL